MNARKKIKSLLITAAACFVLHNVMAAEVGNKSESINAAQTATQHSAQ